MLSSAAFRGGRGGRGHGRDDGLGWRGRGGRGLRNCHGDFETSSAYGRKYGNQRLAEDEDFDYKKDRKDRRKADRLAQKRARIEAQQRWSEERRLVKQSKAFTRAGRHEVTAVQLRRGGHGKMAVAATNRSKKDTIASLKKRNVGAAATVSCHDKMDSKKRKHISFSTEDGSVGGDHYGEAEEEDSESKFGDDFDSDEEMENCLGDSTSSSSDGELEKGSSDDRSEKEDAEAEYEDATRPSPTKKKLRSEDHGLFRRSDPSIPASVSESTRRCVNKLTVSNVVALTQDITAMFGSGRCSRAVVLASLMEQIDCLCCVDAGPLTQAGTLPFAGLLRSFQLLHGQQVGAELVENLCFRLAAHLQAADENATGNTAMVLAQLYLLQGVDALLIASFLRFLLNKSGELATATGITVASTEAQLALAAASCGLTLLRACGEKLLKEAPGKMEESHQIAKRASAQFSANQVSGRGRFQALVSVIGDIVSGHTRKARRSTTEQDAPIEAMFDHLCAILPGGKNDKIKRTQQRVVQTSNTLSGFTWDQLVTVDKPPRWYVPGVMSASTQVHDGRDKANHRSTDDGDDDTGSHADEDDFSDSSEELDAYAQKQSQIRRMRREETAVAGQRFNTEHKREIFKAVASAADDLECFNMLIHRDPTLSRLHDVCLVLVQCCYQEKTFNPYYAQILERFCSSKNSSKKTLQFAIWDRFKSIRIEGADVLGYLNLACMITYFVEQGTFTLSLLRGLDLDNTNRTIGLFTRILLLRFMMQLSPTKLTEVFFGGDGFHVHDLNTDTAGFRSCLRKYMDTYFMDEEQARRWIPAFYDVVAAGTPFEENRLNTQGSSVTRGDEKLKEFTARVRVAYKALKQGIS